MNGKIRLTAMTETRLPDADQPNAVRFCPKCGREIPADQQICVICANTGEVPRPKLPRKKKLLIFGAVAVFLLLLYIGMLGLYQRPAAAPVPASTEVIIRPVRHGTSVPVIVMP